MMNTTCINTAGVEKNPFIYNVDGELNKRNLWVGGFKSSGTDFLTYPNLRPVVCSKYSNFCIIIITNSGNTSYNDSVILATETAMGSIPNGIDVGESVVDKMKKNLDRLQIIKGFKENWNGYGAKAFSSNLISKCTDIIRKLDYQPSLTPTGRESIQIEYDYKDGRYLEFEIFNEKISIFRINKEGVESTHEINLDDNSVNILNKELRNFI